MFGLEVQSKKYILENCCLFQKNKLGWDDKSVILKFDRRHSAYDEGSQYKTFDTKIKPIGQNYPPSHISVNKITFLKNYLFSNRSAKTDVKKEKYIICEQD